MVTIERGLTAHEFCLRVLQKHIDELVAAGIDPFAHADTAVLYSGPTRDILTKTGLTANPPRSEKQAAYIHASRIDEAAANGGMHTKELCDICTPMSAEWERTKDPSGSGQATLSGMCHSFIMGVINFDALLIDTQGRDRDICPPSNFQIVDAKRAFLQYCKSHPDAGQFEASSSLMGALQAAYPCKAVPAHTADVVPHEMTLADLQDICTSHDEPNKVACSFFIYGIMEGVTIAAGVASDKAHFCIPEGLTPAAMELVVKTRIGEDLMVFPDDKKMPAVSFISAAMLKAFPCKSSNAASAH